MRIHHALDINGPSGNGGGGDEDSGSGVSGGSCGVCAIPGVSVEF